MDDQPTGAVQAEENMLHLHGVSKLKPGSVNKDGRMYIGAAVAGEYVRYAISRNIVSSLGDDGTVIMNDVMKVDSGKVLSNGALYVGQEFEGFDITVAVTVIDNPEIAQENQQQAHT